MPASSPGKVLAGVATAALLTVGGLAVAAGAVEWSDEPTTTTTEPASSTTEAAPPTTEAPGSPPPAPPADDGTATPPPAGGRPEGGRPGGALDDVLDGLVEDGTLSQDQADAVTDGLRREVEEWRDAHPRPERPDGPGGRPHGLAGLPGLDEALDAAAEVIGVEPDALRDGLREGRSVAEIADDAGISRQDLIDAVVTRAADALDAAVADGHLTEDRAASLEEHLPGWTERLIDAHRPR